MSPDIPHGARVHIRRAEAHCAPVYLAGHRDIEIGLEPYPVAWSNYYHQLRSEGAIEVVPAVDVAAAQDARDAALRDLTEEELSAHCEAARNDAEQLAQQLEQHAASIQAAVVRGDARQRVSALRGRWAQLREMDKDPSPAPDAGTVAHAPSRA